MSLKYSVASRLLHWISALLVIALFISGWYMVDLDYYSAWYQTLPEFHIVGGILLLLLWLLVLCRLLKPQKNTFHPSNKAFERFMAKWVKRCFYLLVTVMIITGYLIATSQGETLVLFDTLKLPALSHFSASQIDTMGLIHEFASYLLMSLVALHALGALKHHFLDKDDTLKRMI